MKKHNPCQDDFIAAAEDLNCGAFTSEASKTAAWRVAGANIAGFKKVAEAMLAYGVV